MALPGRWAAEDEGFATSTSYKGKFFGLDRPSDSTRPTISDVTASFTTKPSQTRPKSDYLMAWLNFSLVQ